ncbi:MAG: hypothetical protein LKU_01574 [Lactobacillus kefiranofaciens]|nr:hypothetical protein FC93_GL001223 [Lactobacillus kefiranofaciens subsp. kefiranofaciens DSM 5016 = JCM 6985]
MIIFILLLLLTASYMWRQRNERFLTYDASSDPRLSNLLKWTAIALVIESVIGIILLALGNKYLNLITLALASLTILAFSLSITSKKE